MTLQELDDLSPDEREEAERGADAAEQADRERADRIAARQREEAEDAAAEARVPCRGGATGTHQARARCDPGRTRTAPRPRSAANCTNAG